MHNNTGLIFGLISKGHRNQYESFHIGEGSRISRQKEEGPIFRTLWIFQVATEWCLHGLCGKVGQMAATNDCVVLDNNKGNIGQRVISKSKAKKRLGMTTAWI